MANSSTSSRQDPTGQTPTSEPRMTRWPPFRPYPFPGPYPWPGPYGPFPGPYDPDGSEYLLALSAGELHGKALRAAIQRFDEAGKDRRRYHRNNVERLARVCELPSAEVECLFEIIDLVIEIDRRPSNTEIVDSIRRIYHRLVDQNASLISIALSAIVLDSAANAITRGPITEADMAGAHSGGLLGAPFGPIGVLIGMVIGAAGASIEEALDFKKQ